MVVGKLLAIWQGRNANPCGSRTKCVHRRRFLCLKAIRMRSGRYMDRGGNVKRLATVLALAGLCAACGGSEPAVDAEGAAAGLSASEDAAPAAPEAPRFREVTLPAGTTLRLRL